MSSKLLVASAALVTALSAQATVSVTSAAFVYGESFNSLIASGTTTFVNDSTVNGWSLFRSAGTAMTLTAGTGSSNTGGFYSFGAAASTDRALGSLASGSTGMITYALALTNNSGGALDSFTLRYDGEQWRTGGSTNPNALLVEYGFGASYGSVTSWTLAGAGFNFSSVVNTSPAGAVDGNGAGLLGGLGGTVVTNWAAGDTLWLRWTDVDNAGADHGLAIDNVSLSVTAAVPEPSTYGLLLAGLGAVGFMARRRRG